MPVRKLFLSHSSKTEMSSQLLKEVCRGLHHPDQKNGWHVLVDRSGEICPTADWELRLDEWLSECHAAVILISEAALRSWWVQKEATILKWRWRLDPSFQQRLFLVLLGDLKPDVFSKPRFKILNLQQIQCVTEHHDHPPTIITKINEVLSTTDVADTPFERLQKGIRRRLRRVDIDVLEDACDAINLRQRLGEPIGWTGGTIDVLADALARLVLRDHETSLATLIKLLDEIDPPLDPEATGSLYQIVSPLWIKAEAAAQLPLLQAFPRAESRVLAINGKRFLRFTAKDHVRRVDPLARGWVFIEIDATKTAAAEVTRAIRDYLQQHDLIDPNSSDDLADQEIRLRTDPTYVLLPSNLNDHSMLAALRATYPNLTYLVHTGEQLPSEDELPPFMTPLCPPIDLTRENEQNTRINQFNARRALP